METNQTNNIEKKTPNYLKRISTLEKDIKELKSLIENLKVKVDGVCNSLKRK